MSEISLWNAALQRVCEDRERHIERVPITSDVHALGAELDVLNGVLHGNGKRVKVKGKSVPVPCDSDEFLDKYSRIAAVALRLVEYSLSMRARPVDSGMPLFDIVSKEKKS